MLGVGEAHLSHPVASALGASPARQLLLRADVPWTPVGGVREPGEVCASLSSGGGSRLRDGAIGANEEVEEYVFPQRVLDRLAMQESLSGASRRRRKRSREGDTAELDDAADVVLILSKQGWL